MDAARQVFVESNSGAQGNDLERELFLLRKCIEKEKILRFVAVGAEPANFYICTFSNKTIVYKASRCCLPWKACRTAMPFESRAGQPGLVVIHGTLSILAERPC